MVPLQADDSDESECQSASVIVTPQRLNSFYRKQARVQKGPNVRLSSARHRWGHSRHRNTRESRAEVERPHSDRKVFIVVEYFSSGVHSEL
jgi:hypothetical protein